jgi:hypothetical protein
MLAAVRASGQNDIIIGVTTKPDLLQAGNEEPLFSTSNELFHLQPEAPRP